MARVLLVYGFIEGRWHGKKFRRALRRRGHSVVRSFDSADVIIGHSGACMSVPPLRNNQTLVLINPTYWPGRALADRGRAMLKQILGSLKPGNQSIYHANKTAHNLYYAFRHWRKNHFMARAAQTFNLEQEIKHQRTVLIHNTQDPWLTPHLDDLQTLNPQLQILHLPGGHDDCWLHPQPYIAAFEDYLS